MLIARHNLMPTLQDHAEIRDMIEVDPNNDAVNGDKPASGVKTLEYVLWDLFCAVSDYLLASVYAAQFRSPLPAFVHYRLQET